MGQIIVLLVSALYIFLTYLIVKKSKSYVFAVGSALIYYWTLLAGPYVYFILPYVDSSFYLKEITWLTDTFHFSNDEFFLKAFLLYSLYANLILFTVWIIIKPNDKILNDNSNIDTKKMFYFFTTLNLFFLYIFWKAYGQSENLYSGMSALGRVDLLTGKIFDPMYNVAKTMFVMGTGVAGFYFSDLFSKKIIFDRNVFSILNLLMIFIFGVNLILISNNSSIVFGFLVFFMSLLFNIKKIKSIIYFLIAPFIIFALSFCIRGNLFTLSKGVNFSFSNLSFVFRSMVFNGESFAAHLSLYSILKNDVPIFFGKSFIYLINSVVPRFIYDHGTFSIYNYYVNHLDLPTKTGFTIHNASGWYLNFGVVGIILGAIFFGVLWGGAFKISQENKPVSFRAFYRNSFICLTAYIPLYLRGGPETIKPLFIFCIGLPFLLSLLKKRHPLELPSSNLQ